MAFFKWTVLDRYLELSELPQHRIDASHTQDQFHCAYGGHTAACGVYADHWLIIVGIVAFPNNPIQIVDTDRMEEGQDYALQRQISGFLNGVSGSLAETEL